MGSPSASRSKFEISPPCWFDFFPLLPPRILLRFEKLRTVIAYIKIVFKQQSQTASGLTFEGLKETLKVLHGPMER
jgi:hypothetical protein